MTSLQEPAGGAKSAKFVAADPLQPMVDPFSELNDEQKDTQRILAENVNQRLEKALDELREKHKTGTNDIDDPDRAPTGIPYREQQQKQNQQRQQQQQQQLRQQQENRISEQQSKTIEQNNNGREEMQDDDDDSDYDDLLDDEDDPALEAIRRNRMEEIKQAQAKHAENLAKGHGQYRTITQDDFLPECTGSSEWVAIHFFHKEFERCNIMDHHLRILAPIHTTCKFLRIDAEKTPFFVSKLNIRTLPTLLVFQDGKSVDRLIGFEGLSNDKTNNPDQFPTNRLQLWLAKTGAIQCSMQQREQLERQGLVNHTSINSGVWSATLPGEPVQHYDDEL